MYLLPFPLVPLTLPYSTPSLPTFLPLTLSFFYPFLPRFVGKQATEGDLVGLTRRFEEGVTMAREEVETSSHAC